MQQKIDEFKKASSSQSQPVSVPQVSANSVIQSQMDKLVREHLDERLSNAELFLQGL